MNELPKENIEIHQAAELIAYCYFDGKIDQESKFETQICETLLNQIKNNPDVSHRTLAMCWIFFQAHTSLPLGQFIKVYIAHIIQVVYREQNEYSP